MASEIRKKFITPADFTISLASLASSVAGVGRQSDLISNSNNYPAAMIYLEPMTGTAPTANTFYEVYLIRAEKFTSPDYVTDGGGVSDAAITIVNAQLIGAIKVGNNANTVFRKEIDTKPFGPLGPAWGIAIVNAGTGQNMNSTEGNHSKKYAYYVDEAQ